VNGVEFAAATCAKVLADPFCRTDIVAVPISDKAAEVVVPDPLDELLDGFGAVPPPVFPDGAGTHAAKLIIRSPDAMAANLW
jgi:hypothetical protein